MRTYRCDKLCPNGDCCHELREILNAFRCFHPDIVQIKALDRGFGLLASYRLVECDTSLIELLAMALQSRGVSTSIPGRQSRDAFVELVQLPNPSHRYDPPSIGIVIRSVDRRVDLTMGEARELLRAVMLMPADESSQEACKRFVRRELLPGQI